MTPPNGPDLRGWQDAQFLRHLQPLTLEFSLAGGVAGPYQSLVLDFDPGRELVIDVPVEQGQEVMVPEGAQVQLTATHPEGLQLFRCTVRRRRELPSPCLFLSWPVDVRRVQRRRHVRVAVMLPTPVRLGDEGAAAERELPGLTADLSAGGVRVLTPEPLSVGERVEVQLRLHDAAPFRCVGRVVRTGEHARGTESRRFWAGVEFHDLPAETVTALTRFVLDVQREQVRRGL